MKTTLKMPKNKDKPQKNANSKWRPQKVRQHKKYQFWQIIILELELSKISPPYIFPIKIRAKRAVNIFTARLALKTPKKQNGKYFVA